MNAAEREALQNAIQVAVSKGMEVVHARINKQQEQIGAVDVRLATVETIVTGHVNITGAWYRGLLQWVGSMLAGALLLWLGMQFAPPADQRHQITAPTNTEQAP